MSGYTASDEPRAATLFRLVFMERQLPVFHLSADAVDLLAWYVGRAMSKVEEARNARGGEGK